MAVKPEFIGRTGQCPRCKQPVTVPPQSVTTPPGPAAAPPQPQAPPRPGPNPGATQPYQRAVPQPQGAPPMAGGPAARLEVVHGPPNVLGKVYNLQPGRTNVVGRDAACEVSVSSDRVSRRHCQLQPVPGGFALEDLGSSNGTLVNQERVQGRRMLRGGEYIQTGDCLLRYTV
jgi:hypothetical protein